MHDTVLHCDPNEFEVFFSFTFPKKEISSKERRRIRLEKEREPITSVRKKIKLYGNKKSSKKSSNPNPTEQPKWFTKYFHQLTEKNMWSKTPIFNLFDTLFLPPVSTILNSVLSSVEQQEYILQTWSQPPFGKTKDWTGSSFWSPEVFEDLKNAIFKINQLRFALRRFLNHWRLTRFNKTNEEDLFTCEVPKHPIQIVDWNSKQIWTFEAKSLMMDFTNRLLHHEGSFEEPQAPRNPYTNVNLTAGQTISVYAQMLKYAIPNSFPFTAYRASHMNLNCFRFEHRIYLSINALRKTFEDITYYETRDKILDFIAMAFDREEKEANVEAYHFVLRQYPNTDQLQKWKQLCLKYQEFEVKYADFDNARLKAQDKLFAQAQPLLQKQDEILRLYEQSHPIRPRIQVTHVTHVTEQMILDILEANPLLLTTQPITGLQLLFDRRLE